MQVSEVEICRRRGIICRLLVESWARIQVSEDKEICRRREITSLQIGSNSSSEEICLNTSIGG